MKAGPKVKSPAAYLAAVPEERRAALKTLHRAITKAVPRLKPFIVYGMIGYGKYHYRSSSGREGDWFIVGLANQKNYISLYICAGEKGGSLAEKNKRRLGRVSVGRSCIRFKRLEDLDLKVAMELVRKAARLLDKNDGTFVL